VRVVLLALIAALAAGCGTSAGSAKPKPSNYAHFESRPDLRPPLVRVTTAEPEADGGSIFLAPKEKRDPGGPMILDGRGRLVWFDPINPTAAADFRVQTWRGKPVLTWWEGKITETGVGTGRYVIVDDTYRRVATVAAGHGLAADLHEFKLTPRGTALVVAYEAVPRDLGSVGGRARSWAYDSVVQEVTVPGGRVLFEWRSLDHVPLAESVLRKPAKQASRKAPFDYFHVNSVALDADGNLLVSARNTHTIYKLDHRDGRILWRLGGKASDFQMGKGTTFGYQHDARRQADGTITLFDNSAAPAIAKFSRALVIHLDEQTMRATLVRAYAHPRKVLSPHQGSAQLLAGGHMFVGFGGKPFITEFARDGGVLFDAKLVVGDFYRAFRFPWTGRPATRPAVAVRDGTAYVSWNGATEVAFWQLLAGDDEGSLEPVTKARRQGFETAIRLGGDAKLVAVRALDADGTTLRESRAVEVS
jgi:outer membrane protein assembly factor BamB